MGLILNWLNLREPYQRSEIKYVAFFKKPASERVACACDLLREMKLNQIDLKEKKRLCDFISWPFEGLGLCFEMESLVERLDVFIDDIQGQYDQDKNDRAKAEKNTVEELKKTNKELQDQVRGLEKKLEEYDRRVNRWSARVVKSFDKLPIYFKAPVVVGGVGLGVLGTLSLLCASERRQCCRVHRSLSPLIKVRAVASRVSRYLKGMSSSPD